MSSVSRRLLSDRARSRQCFKPLCIALIFFKLSEKVKDYSETKIFNPAKNEKKLKKLIRSPFYKDHTELPSEDGQTGMTEVIMDQRKVVDNKLPHVGVAILQQSKLLFLNFVQFLRDFLKPGSYQPVYAGEFTIF